MRWDALLALATAHELDHALAGGRVQALLLDREARKLLLYGREWTLAMELHPLHGWVSLLPAQEPLPEARRLPARLRSVVAPTDESAVVFHLQRIRGGGEGADLVVELWGNRWNAILVGSRSRTIRHVLIPRDEHTRKLRPGLPYAPLPPTGRRMDAASVSRQEWSELQSDSRALVRTLAYTSSLNRDRYLGDGDGPHRWASDRNPDHWTPGVLEKGDGKGGQPYPVQLPGFRFQPTETLLEAFQRSRQEADGDFPARDALGLSSGMMDAARKQAERAERRAAGLRRQLEEAPDPTTLRAVGDLILARFHLVPRGKGEVALPNFQGGEQVVTLDPTLAPQENAEKYYQEAARAARARTALPDSIQAAELQGKGWRDLLAAVEAGERPPARLAEALDKAMGSSWREVRTGRQGREGGVGGKAGPALPYRTFRTSGGLEIRVGRGGRENDDLTFRHSAPDDIWLHARHTQGAHVILRWNRDDNPPARDLLEAASLAAHFSRARSSGSVPVDWTRRKYVRKPRKSPPGRVTPQRVKTVLAEPDPALVERLTPDEITPGARP
ncbi:MAG: NFACT RNA binding domain-containing protein [Gemmatimonadota bacterium]